jgi:hypothetical protein
MAVTSGAATGQYTSVLPETCQLLGCQYDSNLNMVSLSQSFAFPILQLWLNGRNPAGTVRSSFAGNISAPI